MLKKEATQTQSISQGYIFFSSIQKTLKINAQSWTDWAKRKNTLVSSHMSSAISQRCHKQVPCFHHLDAPRSIVIQLVAEVQGCPETKVLRNLRDRILEPLLARGQCATKISSWGGGPFTVTKIVAYSNSGLVAAKSIYGFQVMVKEKYSDNLQVIKQGVQFL